MTKEEMKREMALFRFSLIAPVVADTYQQNSKMEYFRQIHACRDQFPYITGKKIYEKLIEQGYMKKDDASVDTIYRYLKSAGLTRNAMSPQECLAFEFAHANDCWQTDTTVVKPSFRRENIAKPI